MARRIPRLEGTEDLFLRARTKGADVTIPAAGESDVARTWRSLRWRRLEGLDEEALVPPPLLALSTEEAFDVAEPEPEEADAGQPGMQSRWSAGPSASTG